MKLRTFGELWLLFSLLLAILLVVQEAPVLGAVIGAIFGGWIFALLVCQVSAGYESTAQWRPLLIVWIVAIVCLSVAYFLQLNYSGRWIRSGANLVGAIGLFSCAHGLGGIWKLLRNSGKNAEPTSVSDDTRI